MKILFLNWVIIIYFTVGDNILEQLFITQHYSTHSIEQYFCIYWLKYYILHSYPTILNWETHQCVLFWFASYLTKNILQPLWLFFPFKWCDFATLLQSWSLASIMMRLLSVFINVQWRKLPHMLLQSCDSKVWGMDVCPCLDLTTVLIDLMWSAGWMWLKRTHTPSVYHMFVFLADWE